MKNITLIDKYSSLDIRMCEKHFRKYRNQFDNAAPGGTSYIFSDTNQRGCSICKKRKNEKR